MPNTWVSPQLVSVSTNTSETVRSGSGSGGSATYTPSSRTSVSKQAGASLKPSGGEPHAARAELGGWGRPLCFTKDIWPNFISCALVVRQELIDEQREIVQELVDGIAASGMWLDEDKDDGADHRMQAAEIAGKYYINPEPELLKFVLSRPIDRVKYTDLRPQRAGFDEIMDLAFTSGLIQKRMDFAEYVDDSFALEAADARLSIDDLPAPVPGKDKP
jgi:NitT/TauT family transport system substrate-binding protein